MIFIYLLEYNNFCRKGRKKREEELYDFKCLFASFAANCY